MSTPLYIGNHFAIFAQTINVFHPLLKSLIPVTQAAFVLASFHNHTPGIVIHLSLRTFGILARPSLIKGEIKKHAYSCIPYPHTRLHTLPSYPAAYPTLIPGCIPYPHTLNALMKSEPSYTVKLPPLYFQRRPKKDIQRAAYHFRIIRVSAHRACNFPAA
jgi:hypothetical protein